MAILGLDPGTNFGWAIRFSNRSYFSGVWDLSPKKKAHSAMRTLTLGNRLLEAIADSPEPITLMAYELVRRHKGILAAHVYGALEAKILEISYLKKIDFLPIPVGTIKKFATGSGIAPKNVMIVSAKRKWDDFRSNDDNEADARWIAECAYNQTLEDWMK